MHQQQSDEEKFVIKEQQNDEQEELYKVMMIGEMGAGKSSCCQSISDYDGDLFKDSASRKFCTKDVKCNKVYWKGTKEQFLLIDTPGLLDEDRLAQQNIDMICQYLVGQGTLNAIFVVLNGENPRMNSGIKLMLQKLKEMFGSDFKNHVNFIVTRWSTSPNAIKQRELSQYTEVQKINDINDELIELGIMKILDNPIKCFFVNNKVGMDKKESYNINDYDQSEIQYHKNYVFFIKTHVQGLKQFSCKSLKKVILNENNYQLRYELEKQNWQSEKRMSKKEQLEQINTIRKTASDKEPFDFENQFGKFCECQSSQNFPKKNKCKCNDFLEKMNMFDYKDYAEMIIRNFLILAPKNQQYPSMKAKIKKIAYFISRKNRNTQQGLTEFFNWLRRFQNGKWLMHTFIVVDYQDEHHEGQLSLEFREEGYLMRFDGRTFEGRFQNQMYYEGVCKYQNIGHLMSFCAEYAENNQNYNWTNNDYQEFSDIVWKKFAD